jgi:L-fuconolactonase
VTRLPSIPRAKEGRDEAIIDPELPIIDAHHHLFDRDHHRYMIEDYLEDAALGHRILATVYVETLSMARPSGPETLRPIGEVEFANGMGAMADSGNYGPCRVAAAIVGYADMRLGDRVAETLDRALSVAPDRFRGVRQVALANADPSVLRFMTNPPPKDLFAESAFGLAFRHLEPRGLSFDAAVLHPDLPKVSKLAAAFPATIILLNHTGLAMANGLSPSGRKDIFEAWRLNMRELARHENVFCKIGGLGASYWGFGFMEQTTPVGHEELAQAWAPWVETAIEIFGATRCLMESNYPNDGRSCGFVPLWNAFKLITQQYSSEERQALFAGTASRVYRVSSSISQPGLH